MAAITVVGKLNCAGFHKAKALVESVGSALAPTIIPMQPIDYDLHLIELRRELGGASWAHTAGVAVYGSEFVGDEVALLGWLRRNRIAYDKSVLNSNGGTEDWDAIAESAYRAHLVSTGFSYAFVDLELDGDFIGRMVFELYPNLCPNTCANFEKLCVGEKATLDKPALGYLGSRIHRIVRDGWMQGGDIIAGNGTSGASAAGTPLADECFAVPHDTLGVIGMANTGAHTAGSQFYVTARALPALDRSFVAFGRLVDGLKLLEDVMRLDTKNEAPVADVRICGCGPLLAADVSKTDENKEDTAATRVQAIQRSRNARREMKSKNSAATKVQAINRGKRQRKSNAQQHQAATRMQARQRGHRARSSKKVTDDTPPADEPKAEAAADEAPPAEE